MKEYDLKIYPRSLYLTTDLKEYKEYSTDPSEDDEDALGITCEYVNKKRTYRKGVIIYFNIEQIKTLPCLTDVITHETRHAADDIYIMLGMKGDNEDDEFGAYLQGYMAGKCMEYLMKKFSINIKELKVNNNER